MAKTVNMSIDKQNNLTDWILLIAIFCLTAIRLTIAELPHPQAKTAFESHASAVFSLLYSSAIILIFLIWIVTRKNKFRYKVTALEIPLIILTLAALVASLNTSNLRAAISSATTIIAIFLMAILLVQLLNSKYKILIALSVIAAAGLLNAYLCYEQYTKTNEDIIKQYQQNPDEILERQNITKDSLQHFMFEHRLLSKDIKGQFTTGNSAGSFLILAFFAAAAIFLEKLKNIKNPHADQWHTIASAILVIAAAAGLILTHSKGAIAALVISLVLFFVLFAAGESFAKFKKIFAIILIAAVCITIYITISYGNANNTLPGGKSMNIRWQYWNAATNIYNQKPLTGIGPGNFATYYASQKAPEAIEDIIDPHNFVLSVLTEYGPLGLAGFLLIFLVPLYKTSFSASPLVAQQSHDQSMKKPMIATIAAIFIALLTLRYMINPMPIETTTPTNAIISAFILLYLIPAIVFTVGLGLAFKGLFIANTQKQQLSPILKQLENTNTIAMATFCAIVALLIHNLVDFAIFEPPVLTAAAVILACLIASRNLAERSQLKTIEITPATAIKLKAVSVIICAAFIYFAAFPTVATYAIIKKAKDSAKTTDMADTIKMLTTAEKIDPLNSNISALKASALYTRAMTEKNTSLFDSAEKEFEKAIQKNPQKYENYRDITNFYLLIASMAKPEMKTPMLQKAMKNIKLATERYPNSAVLKISLAQIAEDLSDKDTAIQNYRQAIEIEDTFRLEFIKMYPDWLIVSRLGDGNYNNAKSRLKELTRTP